MIVIFKQESNSERGGGDESGVGEKGAGRVGEIHREEVVGTARERYREKNRQESTQHT